LSYPEDILETIFMSHSKDVPEEMTLQNMKDGIGPSRGKGYASGRAQLETILYDV